MNQGSQFNNVGSGFPDVRGHIISILSDPNRNVNQRNTTQTSLISFDLPQFIEPSVSELKPPPAFRNWFGSSSNELVLHQKVQPSEHVRQKQQQQYQQMVSSHVQQTQHYSSPALNQSSTSQLYAPRNMPTDEIANISNSPTLLGKRKSEEVTQDENKKRELVFKGFTMEPQSKRIKFVNSDRKVDGINDGPWTEQEHEDFLIGLKECGSGKWRDISEKYVKTRTRVQVASHAQKYFSKLKRREKKAAEQALKLQQQNV
jgi:SHAQKYF class myb-like DNA-binding protein